MKKNTCYSLRSYRMNRCFKSLFMIALGVFCSVALLAGPIGCASSKCCGKCTKASGQTASKCKSGCTKPCCKKASAKCKAGCTKPCCKKVSAKGKCPAGCTKPCCKKA